MCKDTFRNSKASYKVLTILEGMLDKKWFLEGQMKQNCHIMVKSYMRRDTLYPPRVAALVYACDVKIVLKLSQMENRDIDSQSVETLLNKIKGDSHAIRLYCCYLLKLLLTHTSQCDIETFVSEFSEIFVIQVCTYINDTIKCSSEYRVTNSYGSQRTLNIVVWKVLK